MLRVGVWVFAKSADRDEKTELPRSPNSPTAVSNCIGKLSLRASLITVACSVLRVRASLAASLPAAHGRLLQITLGVCGQPTATSERVNRRLPVL